MGFLRIFYVRKNITKIFLFSCNLVHEVVLKILAICVALAVVPSSVHINLRKFTKYPSTISKKFLKCLNDLIAFAQSWFDYKQLYSRNFFRKILDFTHEKYTCKIKTIKLKSKGLLKTRFEDKNVLSSLAISALNYFSYFFDVEETPAVKDEKENLENKEIIMDEMSSGVPQFKEDMRQSCIATDTEHCSIKNVHSGHGTDTAKRKPDEEYVHKLKRARNNSETISKTNDASRTTRPLEHSASKDEMLLSSNPNTENRLPRESEEQEILSLLSASQFEECVTTEDCLTLQQVLLKSMEDFKNPYDFNKRFGTADLLVMTKNELYSLDKEENDIQEEENPDKSNFNEKSENKTKIISSAENLLSLKIDESNHETVTDFKKLILLPSNERWKDTADEINALKKEIERKDRVCEFKSNTKDFASNVFSLISEKSEQGISALKESNKSSKVENQSNVVQELSCIRNEDNEKLYKVAEKTLDVITNLSPEQKTSSASISKKNDVSNIGCSISSKEQEHLNFLFASYFRNTYERDNSNGNSGSFDQEMHPHSTFSFDDIGYKSAMSKFQREISTKCDLNANLELPYVSSFLDSPVSEKEYPTFRNETNQNLIIASPCEKKFPNSEGNPDQNSEHSSNVSTGSHSNYSDSNRLRLPLPNFAVAENVPRESVIKHPQQILSPSLTQRKRTSSSEPNSPAKRKDCRVSQHQKLAARIGIDDFEVGECSVPEISPPLKRSSNYKPYPGLISDSRKVKKDARYQKKFYRNPPLDETSPTSKISSNKNLSTRTMNDSLKRAEISSTQKVLTKKVEMYENITSDNPIHSPKTDPSSAVDDSYSTQSNQDSEQSDKTRK